MYTIDLSKKKQKVKVSEDGYSKKARRNFALSRHPSCCIICMLAAGAAGGGEIKSLQYIHVHLIWQGVYSTKKGCNHHIQYLSSAFKARQSHVLGLPVGT